MKIFLQPDVIETVRMCVIWFVVGCVARAAVGGPSFRRWRFLQQPWTEGESTHHEGAKGESHV